MTRQALRSLLLALAVAIGLPTAPRAAEISLDEARRQALAALPYMQGETLDAASLQDRVVVLTFFASWCPPCHVEFDYLNSLRQSYDERQVAIVAVNIFEDYLPRPGGLEGFLAKKAPAFTILGGGEAVAGPFGEVERIPTLFVFGPDGAPLLHFVHARGATKTHASLEEITAAVEAGLSVQLGRARAFSDRTAPGRSPSRPPNRILPWVAGRGSGPVP